ncbi:MAG TPA: hypothetical protein VGR10_03470 [Thermoleophilaceae bacterium]|nr:hypothetical protein [Thermoleophilaceae bacterium]
MKHRITTARLHPVHPGVYAVGRRTALRSGDRTLHHRIPVTTPFATLVDLAARLGESELEAVINEADKLSLINPESLRARRRDRIGGR